MFKIVLKIAGVTMLLFGGLSANAAPINVFATGTMPASLETNGSEAWVFSGSFSDTLVDALGASPGGNFEFEEADLNTLDFSIDGTSIDFLSPTPGLLDSRVTVGSSSLSFSLFLDPNDPFFTGSLENASFSISLAGGPFTSDPEDLSTLNPIDATAVQTSFSLRKTGSNFVSSSGTGTLDVSVSAVPVPAALPLMASALAGFGFVAWCRRYRQS